MFVQTKSTPTSLAFSPDSSHFVTLSASDRQIRVFNFLTGKMTRKYDESLSAIQEMQQAGTAIYKVDDMEFGRRLAVEKELENDPVASATMNAVWDESGNFLIYPTLLGIKGGLIVERSFATHIFCQWSIWSLIVSVESWGKMKPDVH